MANLHNANNNGKDGTFTQSVAGDMFIMVGSDVNTYPSVKVDPTGMHTYTYQMTPSAGSVKFNSAMAKCEELDTSSLFQTGNYRLFAGNNVTLSCGSGGITLDTTGNIKLNSGGGMTAISSPQTLDITSKTMQMTASEGMRMTGGKMEMDMSNTSFGGNVDFGKNLKLQGSLAVQGELYSTHMTAQKQIMLTDEAGGTSGYINPIQSFALSNGSSIYAKSQNIIGLPTNVPPTPAAGMIDAVIDYGMMMEDPLWEEALAAAGSATPALTYLVTMLSGPTLIKVGFPNGVHLISNTAAVSDFGSCAAVDATNSVAPDASFMVGTISDFFGPSHQHQYYIPAATLVDSTDEVWDAAQACNSDKPAPAKEMQLFNMSPTEFMKESAEMAAKKELETYSPIKKLFGWLGL